MSPQNNFGTLPTKDLLTIAELSREDILAVFKTASELKRNRELHTAVLPHKRLAMIFEKDSLRTRFTFDVGMQDLGGSAVFMDHRDARIGSREALRDVARNLERWVHCVVARTFKHRAVQELAQNCSIPVINGLTDHLHPCQALTDTFTMYEQFGDLRGKTMCFVGDGNNTCHSLIYAASKLGIHMRVCCPEGYEPNSRVVSEATKFAQEAGCELTITDDIQSATDGAHVIYTDVWASMGQEDEIEERAAIFAPYQVDDAMMARTASNAVFMHCLPAHRGHEVAASVMDGPQSIVYDIAENRLHIQKAIMTMLMNRSAS